MLKLLREKLQQRDEWLVASRRHMAHALQPLGPVACLRNRLGSPSYSPTATILMEHIDTALSFAVKDIFSDGNYDRLFAFYRFWFDVGQTYHQIASDRIFGAIWNCRRTNSIDPEDGQLIHSTAHLIIRFASDAESDHLFSPQLRTANPPMCADSPRILQQ